MIIRLAREEDYDEIARVWHEGYLGSVEGTDIAVDISQADLRTRLPDDIGQRGWTLYAGEERGRVIAMLAIIQSDKSLDQIYLGHGARGQGYGEQLLDFTKSKMPGGFWLRTHVSNARAQSFYKREGLDHTHDAPHPRNPELMYRWYAWKP